MDMLKMILCQGVSGTKKGVRRISESWEIGNRNRPAFLFCVIVFPSYLFVYLKGMAQRYKRQDIRSLGSVRAIAIITGISYLVLIVKTSCTTANVRLIQYEKILIKCKIYIHEN